MADRRRRFCSTRPRLADTVRSTAGHSERHAFSKPESLERRSGRRLAVHNAALDWPDIYRRLKSEPNDAAAFAALERRVLALARSALSTQSPHLVDDVVADTCAAAVMSISRARGPETFRGFVIGEYLNVRRFYLAQFASSVPLAGHDPPDSDQPDASPFELEVLRRCIERLATRDRLVVELRYFEEASYRLIAEALKVTENNARQITHAARLRLGDCLRRFREALE